MKLMLFSLACAKWSDLSHQSVTPDLPGKVQTSLCMSGAWSR